MRKLFVLALISSNVILSINLRAQSQDVYDRLKSLKVELFTPSKPSANFVKAVRSGNLIFLAGHGPGFPDGSSIKGKLGSDLSLEQGREAARRSTIALLSSLQAEIGNLNKVTRIVKVTGMVNSSADFYDHSKVINGCSDLLVAIFGEKGKHARAAVGMISLPSNIAVEIEMIVEVE